MANYLVDDWSSGVVNSVADAVADIETKLEDVSNSATIHYIDISSLQGKYFNAQAVYKTIPI